jgi:hypothetical protein
VTSLKTRNRKSLPGTLAIALFLATFLFSWNAFASPVISDASIPQSAQSGSPIPVYINMTSNNNDSYEVALYYEIEESAYPIKIQLSLLAGNYINGTWYGEIPPQEWGGLITCSVVVDNGIARYPPQGTVSITVEGPRPSKISFELILLVIFLIIAFIVIELALKPGFWRPTGRERARRLEEEDRKREEEEKSVQQNQEKK